eukprot:TRINITY_DN28551_c0_g1_i1.p1 TRINITY_DN28551_c0_g1~~TRINITY_DN28551_c0_g1_i1.p1  ORF type:complete len:182 (+),score=24.86 TRINITY_DN28551_c0_g1_i1:25-546(+)
MQAAITSDFVKLIECAVRFEKAKRKHDHLKMEVQEAAAGGKKLKIKKTRLIQNPPQSTETKEATAAEIVQEWCNSVSRALQALCSEVATRIEAQCARLDTVSLKVKQLASHLPHHNDMNSAAPAHAPLMALSHIKIFDNLLTTHTGLRDCKRINAQYVQVCESRAAEINKALN